jgi:hypothetical protein
MSQDFKKVLVKDPRLLCTDSINYAVVKGGQNVTSSEFLATSQSNSSHVYNIQVPSEQTIVDRRVMWESEVTLKITSTAGKPGGIPLIQYGLRDSLGPFPLHYLTSVMTATINNSSVSINMRDVLASILRFNDRAELSRYNGMTPTAYDTYGDYSQGVGAINNPLGSWVNTDNNNDYSPRGSWVLEGYGTTTALGGEAPPVAGGAGQDYYVKFKVTEPLLLSPFIFAKPMTNAQGFYGIQNMNFVFNIGDASRAWRSADNWKSVSVVQFENSRLIFNFLTPHPSDLLPARNVVPYYELPRYITNVAVNAADEASVSVSTNTLQLNQIPDKLILFVRKQISSQGVSDPDCFFPIESVSINFNNQSGILSSARQTDLYRYSVENGSNQSWPEFYGNANVVDPATGRGALIRTSGSMLILEFGKDIQITEDFYASGSLANINLQVRLGIKNNTGALLNETLEIVLITMNSGVFICERGTSSQFTGILDKQAVLEASSQVAYSMNEMKRLVGGSFLDTLKSVASKVLPIVKNVANSIEDPRAKAVGATLGAMGYGMSAGGMSAGAKMKKDHRL